MGNQVICDLCGKPICNNNDYERYKYKVKKKWWLWTESGWSHIDVHESCRRKLFDAVKKLNPPSGGSSQQKD